MLLDEKGSDCSGPSVRMENVDSGFFRGASVLSPELKELEKEREMRRHERQKVTINAMAKEGSLAQGMSVNKARDTLWVLRGVIYTAC